MKKKKIIGALYILCSALLFALTSVFAKIVTNNSEVTSLEITFIRFFVGFLIMTPFVLIHKKPLIPVRMRYVLLRAVAQAFTMVLLFAGIQYSTVTNANMLNMTSPVFIFLIAPFINREKPTPTGVFFLLITMAGVYLVVDPGFSGIARGDTFALLSALTAAVAHAALRESKKYDETYLILFYLYIIATVIAFCILILIDGAPSFDMVGWVILSGVLGVLGQFLLTRGYKYIDVVSGSLISTSRILFAGIFGVWIFSDLLTPATVAGGILIIGSLIGVNLFMGSRSNTEA